MSRKTKTPTRFASLAQVEQAYSRGELSREGYQAEVARLAGLPLKATGGSLIVNVVPPNGQYAASVQVVTGRGRPALHQTAFWRAVLSDESRERILAACDEADSLNK